MPTWSSLHWHSWATTWLSLEASKNNRSDIIFNINNFSHLNRAMATQPTSLIKVVNVSRPFSQLRFQSSFVWSISIYFFKWDKKKTSSACSIVIRQWYNRFWFDCKRVFHLLAVNFWKLDSNRIQVEQLVIISTSRCSWTALQWDDSIEENAFFFCQEHEILAIAIFSLFMRRGNGRLKRPFLYLQLTLTFNSSIVWEDQIDITDSYHSWVISASIWIRLS